MRETRQEWNRQCTVGSVDAGHVDEADFAVVGERRLDTFLERNAVHKCAVRGVILNENRVALAHEAHMLRNVVSELYEISARTLLLMSLDGSRYAASSSIIQLVSQKRTLMPRTLAAAKPNRVFRQRNVWKLPAVDSKQAAPCVVWRRGSARPLI